MHEGVHVLDRASKLLQILADDDREVPAVPAGLIGAAVGLRHARTGDTLVLASDADPSVLPGLDLPAPVFTAALEVDSPSQQRQLEGALDILLRQDPSLHLTENEDTGQMLLSGMGELHLEVTAERLRREHGLDDLRLGRMRVAFRERVVKAGTAIVETDMGSADAMTKRIGRIGVTVRPYVGVGALSGAVSIVGCDADVPIKVQLAMPGVGGEAGPSGSKEIPRRTQEAIRRVLEQSAGRGPKCGAPVLGLEVELNLEECCLPDPSDAVVARAATGLAVRKALQEAGTALMEPWMRLEAVVPDASVGGILSDLSANRSARIGDVGPAEGRVGRSTIQAKVPLRAMVGYSTYLRSRTAGDGTFSMALD